MFRLNTLSRLVRPGFTSRRLLSAIVNAPGGGLQYNGASYPFHWLRDSCPCPKCVHPSTRQKLFRTTDLATDVAPAVDGVEYKPDGISIKWAEDHQSFYPKELLDSHASASNVHNFQRDVEPVTWDAEKIKSTPDLFIPFKEMKTKEGLSKAIDQITKYGLLFMTGVPTDKTSNEECALRDVAGVFGEIRETMYGRTWNVQNIRNSRNIAYTNLYLGIHMDLQYMQHPPRYQFLHCLRNRVIGGTSLFVDALDAANTLRETHPEDFEILTKTPIKYHYINDGHHLHNSHLAIELDPLPTPNGEPRPIKFISFSPPFQGPQPLSTAPEFYTAFQRFTDLLDRPASCYEYLLQEGDVVMFDNRRVLHARTAFQDREDLEEESDGVNRWLKGCYMEADGVWDKGRVLRQELGKQ